MKQKEKSSVPLKKPERRWENFFRKKQKKTELAKSTTNTCLLVFLTGEKSLASLVWSLSEEGVCVVWGGGGGMQ
jgi:hypothetical protein